MRVSRSWSALRINMFHSGELIGWRKKSTRASPPVETFHFQLKWPFRPIFRTTSFTSHAHSVICHICVKAYIWCWFNMIIEIRQQFLVQVCFVFSLHFLSCSASFASHSSHRIQRKSPKNVNRFKPIERRSFLGRCEAHTNKIIIYFNMSRQDRNGSIGW